MDVGLFGLLVHATMWALAGLVGYWVIRLGVRHGTLDAYRIDRTDQRIAAMKHDLRRSGTPTDEA